MNERVGFLGRMALGKAWERGVMGLEDVKTRSLWRLTHEMMMRAYGMREEKFSWEE